MNLILVISIASIIALSFSAYQFKIQENVYYSEKLKRYFKKEGERKPGVSSWKPLTKILIFFFINRKKESIVEYDNCFVKLFDEDEN